jgi:hypothetical protein
VLQYIDVKMGRVSYLDKGLSQPSLKKYIEYKYKTQVLILLNITLSVTIKKVLNGRYKTSHSSSLFSFIYIVN